MNLSIQNDVPYHGLENTSMKDAWFIEYRPTIRTIITGGNHEIYLCACMLCVPWMDGCYAISHFGYDTFRNKPASLSRKYTAKEVVEFIFYNNSDDNPSEDDLRLLANFYNSLKHGGFLRPGQNVWRVHLSFSNHPVVYKSESVITIDLQQWVARAINRIDQLLIDATFE
ncbi:MAG: hypothetical protein OXG25_15635 [Gammaproteobacteria bacterium]|nr:hypothetical protein [Gammaproteobacteria bacterium]